MMYYIPILQRLKSSVLTATQAREHAALKGLGLQWSLRFGELLASGEWRHGSVQLSL